MNELGLMYETGKGVIPDHQVAMNFYRDSARLGDHRGRQNLERNIASISKTLNFQDYLQEQKVKELKEQQEKQAANQKKVEEERERHRVKPEPVEQIVKPETVEQIVKPEPV